MIQPDMHQETQARLRARAEVFARYVLTCMNCHTERREVKGIDDKWYLKCECHPHGPV